MADDIAQWLEGLGLGHYAQVFAENSIDLELVAELTEADLKQLGLNIGERRRLQRAIRSSAPRLVEQTRSTKPTSDEGREERAEAERRQLTVMFCDLVGSTALAERLDAEDVRDVIAAYHRCVASAVGRFQGFVAKYMGDGVLVYFGYPQAHEDDAERALRAGLVLVEAIGRLDTIAGAKLQVRIGIATGLVVVGDLVGAGEAREYGVVGETPNLAARLQALADPGTVVIAPSTRQLVGALFDYRDLGLTEVKGFAEPVRAWQVLRASAIASRFEALHANAALTPLVGRSEELELLQRRWEQVKAGDGRVLLLSGEPGIGKSRLIAALQQRLRSEPYARLRYFCSPHHADSALHPIIVQLEHAAGFDREDTTDAKLGKLSTLVARASPQAEDMFFLAELLGLPTDGHWPPPALSPQKRKERTFEALFRQLDGLAHQAPVLMVFEDAHWSDPTSLELLSLIVDRVPNLPVLLIVSYRPEFQPPWIGLVQVTAVSLNRLGRRQSAEIIARVAEGKALPAEVLEQIVGHTDGVPLFVEELTKTVLESGLLRQSGERYLLTGPLQQLAIPSTLHASLMARLDRLAPVKEVAQIAAAIGREFTYQVLSAVAAMPREALFDALRRLVEAELVFQRGTPPDSVYSFKHALVQDAAYATLLRGKRKQIHTCIKRVLEDHFPELAELQPELLAHHSTQAGLAAEAIDYWERAGRRAASQSANREAVAHFRKALDLLPQLPADADRAERELRMLMALGPALVTTRPSAAPEVDRLYARAHQLAREVGRSAELFPAVWGSWMFAYNAGDLPAARRRAEELFGIAHAENDPGFLLQAHHAVWPINMAEADFFSARHHIEAGLRLYRRDIHGHHALVYGGHDPGVCGHTLDAQILAMLGYLDQALERNECALALARELSHPPSLIQALAFAADLHVLRRSPQKVEEFAETLLPLASEFGSPVGVANATMLRGWALTVAGDLNRGLTELRAGLAAWRATGSKFHMPYRLGRAADALRRAGQLAEALEVVADAITAIEQVGERWFEGELHRLKGELLLCSSPGEYADGEACFHHALLVAQEQGTRLFELRAAASLARLWGEHGRCAEACDLLGPIYDWFTEAFDAPDLREAKTLLDALT
jgi:class 3 adenylate cyclase/predicted ATPase